MLKDFAKLDTFLTVVKERSFSKASAKLGISQPAVTQQIKYIEEYLQVRIIERKKNGIRLTKEGEKLLAIAQKMERCIASVQSEMLKIVNKQMTFVIGASFTIGNYILPHLLNNIKESIKNDVLIKIDVSDKVLGELLDNKIDLALIESPIFRDNVIYREWMDDELVLFSNSQVPRHIKKEDLYKFQWICRDWGSHTRKLVNEMFEEMGVDCTGFKIKSEVSSSTAIKQTILKSEKSGTEPTVAILSKYVVADEVANGTLFEAKIRNHKLTRKLYIAYLKDRKNDAYIDSAVNYLINRKLTF